MNVCWLADAGLWQYIKSREEFSQSWRRMRFRHPNAFPPPLQLSAELDPFCEPSAKCGLCYVQAEGPSDTVHHFWATFGSPAVLSVHTQPGVRLLNVSWHRLRKRDFSVAAFRFSEEPIVSSAVVLSKVIAALLCRQ